jgi:hypothetical protein
MKVIFFYYRLRRRVLPQAMSSETNRKITRLYLALKSQLILKKLLELANVTNHKKNTVVYEKHYTTLNLHIKHFKKV